MKVMHKSKHNLILILFLLLLQAPLFSKVTLPKLISDGMVLQRDSVIKIWGWAGIDEKISVHFIDSTYHTTTNINGEWHIMLNGMKAGGPYSIQIIDSDTITIKNVMIGDVWVCSGQSNMELPMRRVSWVYPEIIEDSENENIRQFYVPREYNFNGPQKDLSSGIWKSADPKNVLDFSAAAYFFARALYKKFKVPIGLINTSLGGSPAEAWISEGALKEFPEYYEEAQKFKDSTLIEQIKNKDSQRINAWYTMLGNEDKGYNSSGKPWYDASLNTSGWAVMNIPGYWADTPLGPVNGAVWFRKKVNIPPSMIGKPAKIILGRIVDADSVFINNVFVGTTTYQYPPRRYDIPPDLLRAGENTIVVRVISERGRGGFVPDKPYEIITGDTSINLKGKWSYYLGAKMDPLADQTFIRWKPAGLYNAMIAPLLDYEIKGVIWYQGEANWKNPVEYGKLFPALICNWRNDWQEGDFPFLFVQLPNYQKPKDEPSESNWALIREAQLKTLSLPNTGMAVTIDIGEWNDIHPLDKKDVGERLAVAAEKVAYGIESIVASGPLYESMEIKENRIILSFKNVNGGLITKGGGEPQYFSIAGPDKKFVWAKAKIEYNKVVIWNDKVLNPVAVRYAWADDPEGANLYNKAGLPASPFRTDDWAK